MATMCPPCGAEGGNATWRHMGHLDLPEQRGKCVVQELEDPMGSEAHVQGEGREWPKWSKL